VRSTPVSQHITTRLRKVDENVDPAKFKRLYSASPHLGFGVPCWCEMGGPRPGGGVGPAGLLVRVLGKYLDPTGDRDLCGLQNPPYGVLKFPGTNDHPRGLVAQWVTSDLATCGPVQDVLVQGILDKIYH